MGHLINPIGFRLANKNLKEQYIPLYTDSNIRKSVNNLYEVQLYVKQFFKHGIFQKSGFIFSHFHLYETIKDLTLVLFIYAPDLILSSKYNYVRYLDYVSKKKFINFKRPRVYYTRHPLFAHISSFTRRPTELTTFWYSQAVLDDAKMRLLLKFEKSDFKALHEATSAFFKIRKV